jgi:hypothetical protein
VVEIEAVVFRYRVDGVEVRQRIEPAEEGSGLVRIFERALSEREIRALREADERRPSREHVVQEISQ